MDVYCIDCCSFDIVQTEFVLLQPRNDSLLVYGITGPQGPPGTPGGPTGPQGIQGNTGPQGLQGLQGNTGPQGLQGIQGNTGPQGLQGIQGNTGPQGAQGIQGPIGNTGPQGVQGNIGPQGPIGNTGPQGPIGNTGPQGPIGNTGPQGVQGNIGPQGPIGNTGPQGLIGNTGPQGIQGVQGLMGNTGPQGIQGPAFSQAIGSFISLSSQSIPDANNPYSVIYDTPITEYNVKQVSETNFIVFLSGIYKISTSLRFEIPPDDSVRNYNIWFVVNEEQIPSTNTRITLANKQVNSVVFCEFITSLKEGDSVKVNVMCDLLPAGISFFEGDIQPSTPSIVTNIYRLSD